MKPSAIITYSRFVALVGRTKVDEIRIEGRSGNSDFRLLRVFIARLSYVADWHILLNDSLAE